MVSSPDIESVIVTHSTAIEIGVVGVSAGGEGPAVLAQGPQDHPQGHQALQPAHELSRAPQDRRLWGQRPARKFGVQVPDLGRYCHLHVPGAHQGRCLRLCIGQLVPGPVPAGVRPGALSICPSREPRCPRIQNGFCMVVALTSASAVSNLQQSLLQSAAACRSRDASLILGMCTVVYRSLYKSWSLGLSLLEFALGHFPYAPPVSIAVLHTLRFCSPLAGTSTLIVSPKPHSAASRMVVALDTLNPCICRQLVALGHGISAPSFFAVRCSMLIQ